MPEQSTHLRDVVSLPVRGEDHSTRGWVRLDRDRLHYKHQTEFCITIDTTSYLSPFEARAFADRLREAAAAAEMALAKGRRS